MTTSIRTSTIASIFLALLLLPVVSEAQARRAVPRAAPAGRPHTAAVQRAPYNRPYSGGRYYGSRYYGSRYYGSRYYGPRYYGGYYYGYPYSGGYAYYGAGYGFSIGVGFGYPYGYAYGYPYGYGYGYPSGYAYGYPTSYPYALSSPPLPPRESSDPGQPRERDRVSVSSAQFGSLELRVQPGGAHVTIDGETWDSGDSDRLIVQLGAGVHNIEIRQDGFRTFITDITIRPNETTPLNVAMTRQ
jgi:hypothetical protein